MAKNETPELSSYDFWPHTAIAISIFGHLYAHADRY